MALLRDITVVLPDRVRNDRKAIEIKGYRTDHEEEFFIQLIKKSDEWALRLAFYPSVKESETYQYITDADNWNMLIFELLLHPKVRLYTLF